MIHFLASILFITTGQTCFIRCHS